MRVGLLLFGIAAIGVTIGGYFYLNQNQSKTQDSPFVIACEDAVKGFLVSPSSYKRVLMRSGNNPRATIVWLDYDASNSFGAIIRGDVFCDFEDNSELPELEVFRLNGEENDLQTAVAQVNISNAGMDREMKSLKY